MQSVILDFETYYADDYTLSKMTNESYVRDPRFYAHGVGLVWDNGHREWVTHAAIPARFAEIDWTQTVVISHHCLPGNVEVLTRNGWVPISKASIDQEIMQWDSITGGLNWVYPKSKFVGYAATLLQWDSSFHKCSYTNNHRMYYKTPRVDVWRETTAEEINSMGANNVYIPLSGVYTPLSSIDLTPMEARLMEAIRADGSWGSTSSTGGVSFNVRKERKIRRLKWLCSELGLPLKERSNGALALGKTPITDKIYVLLGYEKEYGMWVIDLCPESREAILEEAQHWDGSLKENSNYGAYNWSCTDTKTVESFQMLAHLTGWSISGTWKDNNRGIGSCIGYKPLYVATVRPKSKAKLQYKGEEVPHNNAVYCFEVPTGAFLIRSNDRVLVTGNSHFDAAILSWVYNVSPAFMCCTLCMARALFPGSSVSLDNITKKLGIQVNNQGKGIMQTKNKPRLTPQESYQLGVYCLQDCDLTKILFDRMKSLIPLSELQLIDLNIRMFTEPVLQLNTALLQEAYDEEVEAKREMMERANADRTLLGSNEALAQMFESLGVEAPMKLSPAALKKGEEKWVYAFSKSDEEFIALQEHEDPKVRALVEARLGIKSTLKETRTQRMLGIASRGPMPIYYNYYGAHSGRFSGGDKNNPQNWTRGSKIRLSVEAPTDHVLVVRDLSQIEARVLACLAGQWDIVEAFEQERDVYSEMASVIFGRKVDRKKVKEDFIPGFIGKAVVLGCIAEGQEVLTDKGLVPIELVTLDMKLWDGEEWVEHDGVVYQGEKECITSWRLTATPDHELATVSSFMPFLHTTCCAWGYRTPVLMGEHEGEAIKKLIKLPRARNAGVRRTYDILNAGPRHRFTVSGVVVHNCGYGLGWKKFQAMIRVGMLGMKGIIFDGVMAEQLGVNIAHFNSRYGKDVEATKPLALTYDQHLIHCAVAKFIIDTFRNNNPEIVKLWKQCQTALEYMLLDEPMFDVGVEPILEVGHESIWLPNDMRICYPHLKKSGKEFSTMKKKGNKIEVSKVYGGLVTENCLGGDTQVLTSNGWKAIISVKRDDLVWDGQQWVSHAGVVNQGTQEVVNFGGVLMTPEHRVLIHLGWARNIFTTPEGAKKFFGDRYFLPTIDDGAPPNKAPQLAHRREVYDILNCGPQHRFTVRGADKKPFLVHNCVQALARIVVTDAMLKMKQEGMRVVMMTHDEIITCCREAEAQQVYDRMGEIMSVRPSWSPSLPLASEGGFAKNYSK